MSEQAMREALWENAPGLGHPVPDDSGEVSFSLEPLADYFYDAGYKAALQSVGSERKDIDRGALIKLISSVPCDDYGRRDSEEVASLLLETLNGASEGAQDEVEHMESCECCQYFLKLEAEFDAFKKKVASEGARKKFGENEALDILGDVMYGKKLWRKKKAMGDVHPKAMDAVRTLLAAIRESGHEEPVKAITGMIEILEFITSRSDDLRANGQPRSEKAEEHYQRCLEAAESGRALLSAMNGVK